MYIKAKTYEMILPDDILAYKSVDDASLSNYHGQLIKAKVHSLVFGRVYYNRGLQRPYTGTYTILQKTIDGFLCLFIVFS